MKSLLAASAARSGRDRMHRSRRRILPSIAEFIEYARTNPRQASYGSINDMVIDAAPSSPDEFAAFIRSETSRWAKVIKTQESHNPKGAEPCGTLN